MRLLPNVTETVPLNFLAGSAMSAALTAKAAAGLTVQRDGRLQTTRDTPKSVQSEYCIMELNAKTHTSGNGRYLFMNML